MTDDYRTSDHQRFDVGDRPRLMVQAGAADISVNTGATGAVEISFPHGGSDRFRIQQRGDRITVRPEDKRTFRTSLSIEFTVPDGSDLKITTASGDVEVLGHVGDVEVGVASGDTHVDGATGGVRIKSVSGDVEIGDASDLVEVHTVSGEVRLGVTQRAVNVATASGDVRIAAVEDICSVNSVSGDVAVRRCDASDIAVRSMSGDVVLGMPRRRRIELDYESVAGDFRNDLAAGDGDTPERTISVQVRSVSGDLTLRTCE